jgi:hypothetical protein
MAFTSIGYDGSVNERQWAELVPSVGSSTYGVKGAGDLKVTAVPGQPLMVSVAAGTGWGHGVIDTEVANTTITCDAISSGTRWDLIAIRRDWQPLAGGPTSAVKVTGTTEKVIPASRKQTPGVWDDQPIALVQWTSGQTQPTQIIDLRCWAGNGGLVANDPLALTYLERLGASVTIAGVEWNCVVGANDTVAWIKTNEVDKIPVFGVGTAITGGTPPAGTQFLVQSGTQVKTTDAQGYANVVFPKAFPNGLLYVTVSNGDSAIDRAYGRGTLVMAPSGAPYDNGTKTQVTYAVAFPTGLAPGLTHRANWMAIGW